MGRKIASIGLLVFFIFSVKFTFSQGQQASEILEKNRTGIISLVAYGDNKQIVGEGTAFLVEDGVLATSYLLISQASDIQAVDSSGKNVKIEAILGFDKKSFTVLLKAKTKAPALILGNSDELEKNKNLFAIGCSESGEVTISTGTISNLFELTPGQKIIKTSFSVPNKYNGGPLIDEKGQVVGILIIPERGFEFIIPSNALKAVQKKSEIKLKKWQRDDYLATTEGSFLAGKIASLLDETRRAQSYLEKVVKDIPDDIEAQALIASVYSRQRNYESAISAYKKVIELNANRDDAYYGLGVVYIKMRRYEEAIPQLERAIQLNPDYKDAYFYIAGAYEELKNFAKAAEFFEKHLSSNPDKPGEVYYHLGLSRFELKQFEAAAEAFEQASKESPQDTAIIYRLAQAYQNANQYEKAAEAYIRLAELSPEGPLNYYRAILGMYDKAGMNDKAVEIAKKIVELTPGNSDSIYNLGYMYFKLKKFNEAIEAFKKVIEMNPGNTYAYSTLGQIYLELKQWGRLVDLYSKLVDLEPNDANAWHAVGVGYMQQKKFDSALYPLKKAVELQPDFGNALFNLAITYLNLHDNYSARETYRKLLKVDPAQAEKLKKYLR